MVIIFTYIENVPLFLDRQERRKYHLHRYKAKRKPDLYLTIITDGMHQVKTLIPRLLELPKRMSNTEQVKTDILGCLIHTGLKEHGKARRVFLDLNQYPHDSNKTINALYLILLELVEQHGRLPDNLYIQMDNTSRENKNQYVLTYMALLVKLKLFKKVCGFMLI